MDGGIFTLGKLLLEPPSPSSPSSGTGAADEGVDDEPRAFADGKPSPPPGGCDDGGRGVRPVTNKRFRVRSCHCLSPASAPEV
jgi:hypothetical protein